MTVLSGKLLAPEGEIAIVASRFNQQITEALVAGARDTLVRHGVVDTAITVIWVPGAFEIPAVTRRVLATDHFIGVLTLGAVIRGETTHYDLVSQAATHGIAALAETAAVPVMYGVLATDTLEQAQQRAGGKAGNQGAAVATGLLEMITLYQTLAMTFS